MASSDNEPSLVGIISDADDFCNLFTGVFGDDLLTGSDKDTIVETAKRSLQNARLFREYDFDDAKDTQQTVMCEHTSQFTGCRFWIDEDSDEKVVLISETEASAYEYKWWQGFTEYEKSAISNISLIPQKVRRAGTEIDIWDRPIPADVKIPEKLPSLPSNSSMVAATVVREFELKVVDVDGNEVYTPLRLWTKEARSGKTIPSTFCTRLNMYYAIKVLHSNVDPENIDSTAKTLVKEARSATEGFDKPNDFWYNT